MKAAIYARISTPLKNERQNPNTQLVPLREFCARRSWQIAEEYLDDISAVKRRPEYDRMLADARAGRFSIIVSVKLDRLFRSLPEFIRVLTDLNKWNVRFVSTDENIDTDRSNPEGILFRNLCAAFAEFERSLISERVKAGIARYRGEGKPWHGRPRKLIDVNQARELRASGYSLEQIGRLLGCNRNIVARELAKI